jgi:two-component system, response regulator FlrC
LTTNWPGNIRELENVIKRAVILAKGSVISPELLFEGVKRGIKSSPERSRLSANYLNPNITSSDGDIYKLVH